MSKNCVAYDTGPWQCLISSMTYNSINPKPCSQKVLKCLFVVAIEVNKLGCKIASILLESIENIIYWNAFLNSIVYSNQRSKIFSIESEENWCGSDLDNWCWCSSMRLCFFPAKMFRFRKQGTFPRRIIFGCPYYVPIQFSFDSLTIYFPFPVVFDVWLV